jgi:hypothetical protein
VLGDLEHKPVLDALDLESVEDGRDLALELHVHDSTDDLSGKATTCEIWPFFRVAALAVEKRDRAPLIMLRINIFMINKQPSIQLIPCHTISTKYKPFIPQKITYFFC